MQKGGKKVPGIIIAGLRGGSGKTVVSLGITAAWKEKGFNVSPFKKGPDYIDAGWLSKAAGRPCYNLDTFLCPSSAVKYSYIEHSQNCDICVIEGNRGLYDGIDTDGSTSTAELAKLLNLPILLVLDCTKATRTMAALVLGCMKFDPDIRIIGVILNRVAGKRHEKKLKDNIEKFCQIPVFGAIPKLDSEDFPERHMGLVTSEEHHFADKAIQASIQIVQENIDLNGLYTLISRREYSDDSRIRMMGELEVSRNQKLKPVSVTIGIIRDSAFQFYYPDNIDALIRLGATIVYISPLKETSIPDVDAIYMGGGFPETHAAELAQNIEFKRILKRLSLKGLPIYAECGGLIFLGQCLSLEGVDYPMTGIFQIRFGLCKQPQGHGYTRIEVVHENPFFKTGEILTGHEFRYSSVLNIDYQDYEMAFRMDRGKGIVDKRDGFFKQNTFGTYTHIHALGTPSWASSLIGMANTYKALKS
ncbi:MAG: cobyrinic acid a,c-diamide synthase [Desulfobacterales bacterium RIFOXYA12_FULL_46_15]|nr:MAG: cobyrinic acid a,c-diamide synthase [Desulfobacula sp. GWF2_41_7]OGR27147.1 MAG: cobyrinic acid a,c-diamide synthase [Desulfobacterales bacterium RIFOXYA12_FULL_46_15]